MSFKTIAICLGLFSLVVGLLTYDPQVITAPFPVITGALVVVLALAGLIPEFRSCCCCQKKIFAKAKKCRFCGAQQ
ncbi:MAG: hypothetical protein A2511_03205 [Deltaproteobacteria bacterium RIFOXYD12_FULL_50_9]|nr:MAG: hypothetical protein A2511_03205 [Deltaproteobacteria bacterium RIFOXYD12_FULL_50_9]